MLKYETFYRKYGMRKNSDFNKPILSKVEDFELPKSSVVLNFYKGLHSNGNYIKSAKSAKGFIVSKYTCEECVGVKGSKSINVGRLISARLKEDRGLQYLPSVSLASNLKPNVLLGVDYSILQELYVYSSIKRSPDYKKYNTLLTIVDEAREEVYGDKNYFLPVRIPSNFPSYPLMEKMYDNFFKYSNSSDLFIWIEIFKMLKEDSATNSVFNGLGGGNLTLLIEGSKEVVVIELHKLFSLSKDSGFKDEYITPVDAKQAWLKIIRLLKSVPVYIDGERVISSYDNVDEIEDSLLEDMKTQDVVDNSPIEVITDVEPKSEIERGLNQFKDAGVLDSNFMKKHSALIESNNKRLEELSKRDTSFKKGEVLAGNNILDKSLTTNTVYEMHKTYMEKHYELDIEETILSLSNGGVLVKDIDIKKESDIGNRVTKVKVKVILPNGTNNTLDFILPTPDERGVFLNSGNEYVLNKQRGDIILKKIGPTSVSLMTYYGKLFINKGQSSKYSKSKDLAKKLKTLVNSKDSSLTMINTGTQLLDDKILPTLYGVMIREIKGLATKTEKYDLKYEYHLNNLKESGLPKDSKDIIIGKSPKGFIVMNHSNEIYTIKNGKVTTQPKDFLTHLGIDTLDLPLEYAEIKILGVKMPVIIVLMRWKGIKNVLKTLKHRVVPNPKEIRPDEHSIRFADGYITFNKGDIEAELLLGGLKPMERHTKHLNRSELDSVDGVKDLIHTLGNVTRLDGEMRSIETMFIDPMAKRVLKEMKEPTKMYPLLLRCVELLLTDNYEDPYSSHKFLMRGYERVPGMIYSSMTNSFRVYSKKSGLMKAKMEMNPFEIYTNLASDATFSLVEDQNPLEAQKQMLEVKSTGMFGRGKESMMVKDRAYHINDVGIYSEAGKDDSNVGSTIFASENANVLNVNGMIESVPNEELTIGSVYSPSSLMLPGSNTDDGKRMLYSSIMDKHVSHMNNSIVLPFRTGYESMLPYKVSAKFAVNAKRDGKVIKVDDKEVVIKYKDSEESYSLTHTTSRVIGGKNFLYKTKTLLKKGDKVKEGYNITYNSSFFGQDMLNPHRVAYKGGLLANVALDAGQDSFEDSTAISENMKGLLSTTVMETKGEIIDVSSNIMKIVNIGDKVDIGDALAVYVSGDVESFGEGMGNLEELNATSFKSEAKGIVREIKIYYFAELGDISDTLKRVISSSDKRLKAKTGHSGKVTLGFSKDGRHLIAGEALIVVSVEKELELSINDKYIIGNQLKTTVGRVYKEIKTKSGKEVDCLYGDLSVAARIVQSPYTQGTMNAILQKMEENILEIGL